MKNKSLFRLLTIETLLIAALAATAPRAAAQTAVDKSESAQRGAPKVETQLKFLADRLDLAADQQAKLKPILQELHEALLKLLQNNAATEDERMDQMRTLRLRADKQIRKILSDDQQKKLDQLESEPHSELHGE